MVVAWSTAIEKETSASWPLNTNILVNKACTYVYTQTRMTHTHVHTNMYTHTLVYTYTHVHTCRHPLSLYLSLSHTHTLSYTQSHVYTHISTCKTHTNHLGKIRGRAAGEAKLTHKYSCILSTFSHTRTTHTAAKCCTHTQTCGLSFVTWLVPQTVIYTRYSTLAP